MIIDWISGGILLPAVFKKSPKSENEALESRAGFKGLRRKKFYEDKLDAEFGVLPGHAVKGF